CFVPTMLERKEQEIVHAAEGVQVPEGKTEVIRFDGRQEELSKLGQMRHRVSGLRKPRQQHIAVTVVLCVLHEPVIQLPEPRCLLSRHHWTTPCSNSESSFLTEHEVDRPTPQSVWSWPSAVSKNLLTGASCIFKGVGQRGQPPIISPIKNRLGELYYRAA